MFHVWHVCCIVTALSYTKVRKSLNLCFVNRKGLESQMKNKFELYQFLGL